MVASIEALIKMREELRAVVDRAIRSQDESRAIACLDQLLRESPTIANAQFVVDRMRMVAGTKARVAMRLAILRSFTVEPLVPLLKAAATLNGLDLEIWVGGFNTYAQEMLDPGSDLYKFEPTVVLLAVQARDLAPDLWGDFVGPEDAGAASVQRVVDAFRGWIDAFGSRSRAHVLIQNLEMPDSPSLGILDAQATNGQRQRVLEINRGLIRLARETLGVHVLDYDSLVARHGRRRWHDERKWLSARMPISADCLMLLAQEYLRFLLPLAGLTAKVLVVDLDNTLWGGVVAEDGMEGIEVDSEYPGAAYQALHRAILAVRSRGVLLAIASKNTETDALEALDGHQGMLLRSQDFAAKRINWNDKTQSLREIAAELNVGVDSLAFLDDSPIERDRIRRELPEVNVIELPTDPVLFAQALLDNPAFERLSLSEEDRERGRLYTEQRERATLKSRAASLEDFLRSLEMEMDMTRMAPDTLARVAQLTQKTNQFNLTTRRYTEQEIAELAASPNARVYQVRVRDRLGDSGLVGVAITKDFEDGWEIDTLLLSCRVIGRTIEKAMLAKIADDAIASGASHLYGWFLATRKNVPAGNFFADNGFSLVQSGDGASRWQLDLEATRPSYPDWILCGN